MFFDSWTDLARIALLGTTAYVGLVAILRLTGKRTLSKMNAFDLVVTVALGSTLATILLSEDVALAEGLAALALLCLLQYGVAAASVRHPRFEALVKAEPRLVYHRGRFLEDALIDERVSRGEILAAVRATGRGDLSSVGAVVLETDGSFSVVAGDGSGSALADVKGG